MAWEESDEQETVEEDSWDVRRLLAAAMGEDMDEWVENNPPPEEDEG